MGSGIVGMVGHLDCYDIPCVQINTTMDAVIYLMLVVVDSGASSLVGSAEARSSC